MVDRLNCAWCDRPATGECADGDPTCAEHEHDHDFESVPS